LFVTRALPARVVAQRQCCACGGCRPVHPRAGAVHFAKNFLLLLPQSMKKFFAKCRSSFYNKSMAKVSYVSVSGAVRELYYKGIKAQDRFITSRVVKNYTLLSRKKIKGLTARSLLPQIKDLWNGLSTEAQEAWSTAADEMSLTGYRLFVQDTTARLKQGLSGLATPSILHQSWVGQLHIESPATQLKITQLHPRNYWISSPVRGKKGMRELVEITEDFALPLKISLNYKGALSAAGGSPSAKFYAIVWSSYQGRDIQNELAVNLDLAENWQYAEATLSEVLGYVVGYNLYIYLYDLQGDLYIDNIKAEHSAQNWVRDTYCKDINQAFTRAFYQVPKHWVGVTIPDGTWFESVYKDF